MVTYQQSVQNKKQGKLNNAEPVIFIIDMVVAIFLGVMFFVYYVIKPNTISLALSLILLVVGIGSGVYIERKTRKEIESSGRNRSPVADAGLL